MTPKLLLFSALSLSVLSTLPANADTPREHRIVDLQAESSRDVQNDEMQATLYTELNNSNPALLARDTAQVLNSAVATAKDYPDVKLSTGNQNTYPVYDKNNKLSGWRSRAEVQLKTTNFKAGSELIAKLQSSLQLDSVNFSVSDQQRYKVEKELLTDVTKQFRERATVLQDAWGASKYELVQINVNTGNSGSYRPMPMMMRAAKAAGSDSIPAQDIQSGNSQIRVTASGSIQLQ